MRTSYKTLLNIIKSNFNYDDIRKSPSQGQVVVFTEGTEHVRIVLVEGNSYSDEIGCHIRMFETREELESSLVSAVETALKDNFLTIWVHQKPKQTEETKAKRVKNAREWLDSKNLDQFQVKYSLNKKCISDAEQVLESMSQDQLDVLLGMVSAAYSGGCASTREFFKKQRERAEVKGA